MNGLLITYAVIGAVEVALSAPIALSIYHKRTKKKNSIKAVTLADCVAMYNMGYSAVCADGKLVQIKKEKAPQACKTSGAIA